MTTPVHYPLPRIGLCGWCEGEARIRRNGLLYAHGSGCGGSGSAPAAALPPTFARWLHSHAARRDDYTNPVTQLAVFQFRGCTRSPHRTPGDVPWSTAEGLHRHLHERQFMATGSEILRPHTGERCDWMCELIQLAAGIYRRLTAAIGETPLRPVPDREAADVHQARDVAANVPAPDHRCNRQETR